MEELEVTLNNGLIVIPTMSKLLNDTPFGRTGWWEDDVGLQRIETLRRCYLQGASDSEACYLAGISKQQLYTYQTKVPDFREEKKALKLNTVYKARLTVNKAVETDSNMAWKYLSRKLPEEFGENNSTLNNFGTMNTQINKEYFEVPDNIDELLDDGEQPKSNN